MNLNMVVVKDYMPLDFRLYIIVIFIPFEIIWICLNLFQPNRMVHNPHSIKKTKEILAPAT